MSITKAKTPSDLREKFEDQTGYSWQNSQGEPDIDYVMWLEANYLILCNNNHNENK